MEGRLLALGRAHDLLMQISWSNASLTHTFSGATEPYDSQGTRRFHFNGPDIRITSGAVIALAMTLNELCTNTTKFGALSNANGRVEIAWTIDEEKQRMRLTWTEKGGPPVQRPTRRSFGTRMMESLGQQLNGRVQLTYDPVRVCLFPGCTAWFNRSDGVRDRFRDWEAATWPIPGVRQSGPNAPQRSSRAIRLDVSQRLPPIFSTSA